MNPTNAQLGTTHDNLSAKGHSLPPVNAQAPEVNRMELSQAQDLADSSSGKKSIQNRQPGVKQAEASGLTKYELLASLPPELIAPIVSYLNQEDLCSFFYSIVQDLIATYKAKLNLQLADYAKTGVLEKKDYQHWSVKLLDVFLKEISVPIYFDQSMALILDMAKRLGIKEIFSRVPSLRIDFKRNRLSYEQVMGVCKKMSIGVKQLELEGVDTEELSFSTKYFPHLEGLKIAYSKALKSLEVEDESAVLKALTVAQCPSVTTLDIQACDALNRLECVGVKALGEIKMVKSNQLKELTLKGCDLEGLNLENLADWLAESCIKLNLKGAGAKYHTRLKGFVSRLEQLREIHLVGIDVSLKNLCALEKITLEDSPSAADLSEYTCATALKELNLKGSEIKSRHCLKDFTALEALKWEPESNEDFANTLACLKKLKRLTIDCECIDDCGPLAHLLDLEELVLSTTDDLSKDKFSVLSQLKKLKKLHIANNPYLENLEFLMNLESLEELSLVYCVSLLPESFSVLEHLTKLKKIDLANTQIENLDFLETLRSLEELGLKSCKTLAPASLKKISLLQNLKRLNLESYWGMFSKIEEIDLEFLKDLIQLEELNLAYNSKLNEKDCAVLAHLKNLKKLNLRQVSLGDIDFLAELTKLEDLNLMRFGGLKFEKLAVLKYLTKLRRLDLQGIPVKDLTLFEYLKDLEYIHLGGTRAFHRSSRELAVFPSGCEVVGLEDESYDYAHYDKQLLAFIQYKANLKSSSSDSSDEDEDLSDSE